MQANLFTELLRSMPLNQNFQADCSPVFIKGKEGDSLKATFRFYEIEQSGDLKKDLSHRVNYSVRIGDKMFDSVQDISSDNTEQIFKCRLPETGENDSVALLKVSVKDERLTFEKEFRIPLKEDLDFQFFPEGGSLVNGIESRIAFKATGTDGLSREVKGVVKETGEGKRKDRKPERPDSYQGGEPEKLSLHLRASIRGWESFF